ncbi:hypothetical protein [Caenispirillum bisanense]|uniref:Tail assembly chaperone n=1 Tax=Caenispirillum bisanense TaxID=414052 RepID=A0A286GNB5_9PROT|nr:hypothetical protein [Caenispirillum bisanense]SOD97018.1 hypothetical protein SAMN05421508_106210 [Caenispirillum bisanense]
MVKLVSTKELVDYTPEYYTETGAENAPVYRLRVPNVFDRAKVKRELATLGIADLGFGGVVKAANEGIDLIAENAPEFDAEKAKAVFGEELGNMLIPGKEKSAEFADIEALLQEYPPYMDAVADFGYAWDVLPLVLVRMFLVECAELGVTAKVGGVTDADLAKIPANDLTVVGFYVWGLLFARPDEKKD